MKKRLQELDFLKGTAIILVVIGHVISQVLSRDPVVYEENPVFRTIYSFHMPLFTFISGYICRLTVKTDSRWLIKRIRQIGIPYLLALILWYLILKRESISSFFSPMAYWYLPFVLIADTVLFCENRFRLKGLLFGGVIILSVAVCRFEKTQIDIAHHLSHCLIFYAAGSCAPLFRERHKDRLLPIYCILTAGFLCMAPLYGQGLDRQINRLESIFGSLNPGKAMTAAIFLTNKFIVPVCGIGAVLLLTYAVYHAQHTGALRSCIELIGQHTLFIYILHDLFFLRNCGNRIASCVISVLTALIIPLMISVVFRRIKTFIPVSRRKDK